MPFSLIATLGPSLNDGETLVKINNMGNIIFRINGAHANPEDIKDICAKVRKRIPAAKIMLDLPGNKVRLANLPQTISVVKGSVVSFMKNNFNYEGLFSLLTVGDTVLTNDSQLKLKITKIRDTSISCKAEGEGIIRNNKGFNIQGISKTLPFLFARDKDLIKAAIAQNVAYISLSFVRNADDIKEAKKLIAANGGKDIELISKIETASAMKKLPEIMREVEMVNIDRGDLTTDIGIFALPAAIDTVIEKAQKLGKKVFIATQFLKSMEKSKLVLLSEVTALAAVIKQGVAGIQLSEETAVGAYPIECVKFVFDTYKATKKKKK